MLFMVIIDSLHLIFEKTWMRVAATIAILILLSITGTVAKSAIFLLDFWNVFELFQDLSFLGVLASIALIVIVILIFPWIRRKIKKEQILTKAKIVGQEAGAGLRMVRADYKRKKKVLEG